MSEPHPNNDSVTLENLVDRRLLSRRQMMQNLGAVASLGFSGAAGLTAGLGEYNIETKEALSFEEIEHGLSQRHVVAKGYEVQFLVRWGDPIFLDTDEWNPQTQSPELQAKQFGYNNDFLAFLPLPFNSKNSNHGLLCANHEYTNAELMFPNVTQKNKLRKLTREQIDIEMLSHGHSVVEIERKGGRWKAHRSSPFNRRINALDSAIRISGPAAGDDRMKTSADPSGKKVLGMLGNCAGGVTPWGTVLTCEENIQFYFEGISHKNSETRACKRYGIGTSRSYGWSRFHERFQIEKEPHEPNRFGWVVEIDPYQPNSVPVKRTALGRMRHEAATVSLTPEGRVVVYTGDDSRFEYLYRFVSDEQYDPKHREKNRHLLDRGTLYVAKFSEHGTMNWLPLKYGEGPITKENGFASQAEVMIETRRAADLLGATPMDRPEDVEENPVTGKVYVILTNNTERTNGKTNVANPRAANRHGHIIELIPPQRKGKPDHGAEEFRWEFFIMAGNPHNKKEGAKYNKNTSDQGWLSCPDNCAFDAQGRIWIATDGAPKTSNVADAVYVSETVGPNRALTKQFFRAPVGAEICGPAFTPDCETLFLAIQHPGDGSTFDKPSTRWPDFMAKTPPRPTVVAITRTEGGLIGT